MRVALAQINACLGDFAQNREKILSFVERAKERHCDLVVFPEASLFGYHPMDLLEYEGVVAEQLRELKLLSKKIPKGIAVFVGAITVNPDPKGKPFHNSAVFLEKGKAPKIFPKELLPTYDVFDEGRHIEKGSTKKNILKFKGQRILVTICEDIWAWPLTKSPKFSHYSKNPLKEVRRGSVDLVINLSASPFTDQKMKNRREVTRAVVQHLRVPLIYVNMVGAQDELIFDGGSFAIDSKGKPLAQCLRFEEDLNTVDLEKMQGGFRPETTDINELRRRAISLGIHDFANKSRLSKVHLGLSGGIDSALVACLAVDALGPSRVTAIAMPGPFNASESLQWAEKLANQLGIRFHTVGIESLYESALGSLEKIFGKMEFGVLQENLQARIRGVLLMGFSNHENSLLLNTSNKSELAVGYGTLYGDLCGGLSPIGDLFKTEVYALARYYNQEGEIIPNEIIERAPSAELRPNQKDQDSLPPYEELDAMLETLVEEMKLPKTPLEKKYFRSLMLSEFKRWQAPPILKLSGHAFGQGRRFPIANRFSY